MGTEVVVLADFRSRLAALLHGALPLVIGMPVLIGIVVTIGNIIAVSHPDLGWAHTVANDAKALAIGESLYADPTHSYSGMLYTPLYPLLLAPLYRLHWWDGWPPLVTTVSGLGLASLVAFVAIRPLTDEPGRLAGLAGGIGIGGLSWWLVSANPEHMLYAGRSDQLAWFLAFLGLLLLARDASRGLTHWWLPVVILSAALWTKQTTVGVTAAALIGVGIFAALGVVPSRACRRFGAALVASNIAVFSILCFATKGWAWHALVTLPSRHGTDRRVARYLGELRTLVTPSLVLIVLLSGAVLVSRRSRTAVGTHWRSRSLPFAAAFGSLLVLLIVLSLPVLWTARRKQGGDANQYIGIIWAAGFLIALLHREARRARRSMCLGSVAYGMVLVAMAVPSLQPRLLDLGVALPTEYPSMHPVALPSDLVDYSRDHEVFVPERGLVTSGRPSEMWPAQPNIIDLLAAGDEPGYLLDALLDRRFDAVAPFDPAWEGYASAYGRRDTGYLRKLNLVIEAGYEVGANGAPPPLLGRRPQAMDLSWARPCFTQPAPTRCEELLSG